MRKLYNHELPRLTVDEFKKTPKTPFIVILDNVRSLNNIGSIFRTCDAFVIEQIILCGISATPPHKDIHKTALGATESVDWRYYKSAVDAIIDIKKNGYQVFAIEQTEPGIFLHQFNPESKMKYAFVFGNEVRGVSQQAIEKCDGSIEIPQYGTKHSFNIAVSAGIVLWDIFCKYND